MTETNKFIRNVIACKSLDEQVRQRFLEKTKNLTLETTISIGRMFEATRWCQVKTRELKSGKFHETER